MLFQTRERNTIFFFLLLLFFCLSQKISAEKVFEVCMNNPVQKMCSLRFEGSSKFFQSIKKHILNLQTVGKKMMNTLGCPSAIDIVINPNLLHLFEIRKKEFNDFLVPNEATFAFHGI